MATLSVNVTSFVDARKVSPFQILVVVLCFLIVAIDGFDTAAIGSIAPAIRSEWNLSPAQLAPLFGAGLAGLMVGAFLFGPLAGQDRAQAGSALVRPVLRRGEPGFSERRVDLVARVAAIPTGSGLGGAMPECGDAHFRVLSAARRSFLVTTMFCGFTVGSALGGLVSAHMVGDFGWRSILILGGVLPLLLLPVLWRQLPESARFLVLGGKDVERVKQTLLRMAPELDLRNASFVVSEGSLAASR